MYLYSNLNELLVEKQWVKYTSIILLIKLSFLLEVSKIDHVDWGQMMVDC